MKTAQQVWIRAAKPDDREPVTRLLEVGAEREGQGDTARSPGLSPERCLVAEVHQAQLPQARLAVADEAGCCIVGAACLDRLPDGSVDLGDIVVDPRCRGQGIDHALAEAASERAAGPGEMASPAPRADR